MKINMLFAKKRQIFYLLHFSGEVFTFERLWAFRYGQGILKNRIRPRMLRAVQVAADKTNRRNL